MRQPADLADRIGSGDYYSGRHEDFAKRHKKLEPPPYYLQYGLKYFQRFQSLRDKLSEEGKSWITRTAYLLQKSVEDRRKRSPRLFDVLERHPQEFQRFAYGSHPTAYLQAGLGALPPEDVLLVVNTPDAKDLLTSDGIAQVVKTALAAIQRNGPTRNARFVEEAMVELGTFLQHRADDAMAVFDREIEDATSNAMNVVEQTRRNARAVVAQIQRSLPTPWIMRQSWRTPLFCSWRVRPELIRPLVPPQLDLDLHDGYAWVSTVPLEMENVSLIRPPTPPLPQFAEVNLRTYVRHGEAPGVHFISLECGQLMIDFVAKLFFHLPYRPASVSIQRDGDWFRCRSQRGDDAVLDCRYRPLGSPAKLLAGSLDQFLTERYSMFVVDPLTDKLYRGDVRHEPWTVQEVTVEIAENTLLRACGLPVDGPPDHVGFSPGVETETFPFVEVS